jgi:hypothetical protein
METEVVKQELVSKKRVAKSGDFRPVYVLSVIVALMIASTSAGTATTRVTRSLPNAVPLRQLLPYRVGKHKPAIDTPVASRLYLPWISLFVFSGSALALGIGNFNIESLAGVFSSRIPVRLIAGFLFYTATMISFLWISQWIKFLATGRVPDVNGSQSAYQIIAAVDLSFMVPMQFSAAYLLFRRRPLGYVLGAVALVQGAVYTAVMATICVFSWKLTPGSQLFPSWFINCVVGSTLCLVCLAGLLLGIKRPEIAGRAD